MQSRFITPIRAEKLNGKTVFTRWPMTGAVMAGGWLSFKNMPGSLDYIWQLQGGYE